MNPFVRSSLGVLLGVSSLVGCATGGLEPGDGGAGGTFSSGSPSPTSTVSTGSSDLGAQIAAACASNCVKVDALSQQLHCQPTPTCVGSCEQDGTTVPSCEDEYLALITCATSSLDESHCSCTSVDQGNILACTLCPQQVNAYQNCLATAPPTSTTTSSATVASSSATGGDLSCDYWCQLMMTYCQTDPQYDSIPTCISACTGAAWPLGSPDPLDHTGNTLSCHIYHAQLAETSPDPQCYEAGFYSYADAFGQFGSGDCN